MAGGARPGAGRKKGVKNKDTQALWDLISEKYPDFDPVIGMIELYYQTDDEHIKITALKESAKFLHSQLKAVEHSVSDGTTIYAPIIQLPNPEVKPEAGSGVESAD